MRGRGRSYRRKALIYCAQTAATAVNTYNLSCTDIQHLAAVVCEAVKQQGLMTDYNMVEQHNTTTAKITDSASIDDTAKRPPAVVLALLQLVSYIYLITFTCSM
jgi:hypothetical protein